MTIAHLPLAADVRHRDPVTVSVVVPFRSGDEWRDMARAFVLERIQRLHPTWEIVEGICTGEWSKGAAVADGVARATGDVLVLHDADSYTEPDNLAAAVERISMGDTQWVVPHGVVYRLREAETLRVLDGARARLGHVARAPYTGPHGGGVTVLTRQAWDTVNGIDPRFFGWGGEDVAFGWALETLVAWPIRLDAALVHLWHPHPAPDLRGSEASEALVADYRTARGLRRRMAHLVAREPIVAPTPLDTPVAFRLPRHRNFVKLPSQVVRFVGGQFSTNDPDLVDALRDHSLTTEVKG